MPLFIPFGARLIRVADIQVIEKIDRAQGKGFTIRVQVGALTYDRDFPSTDETPRDDAFDVIVLAADP